MNLKISKAKWYLLIGILLFTYCKKDKSENLQTQFSSVIKTGGVYENPQNTGVDSTVMSNPIDSTTQDAQWSCTRTHYNVTDGNEQQPLFDPSSNVIYPGNLLQGKTLNQSPPDVIVVERAGGTISYNLNNGNLVSSFKVDQVTKSSITDAMNNIIHNAGDVLPANFVFSYSEVQSEEQLALELGVDVKTTFVSVKSKMNFDYSESRNRILVKLSQQYYTMSFDLPTSYDKLFAPSVTPNDLARYVGAGNPATYISDVTYGRIFYMLFESSSSSKDMKAAISGSFKALSAKVSSNVDISAINKLSNLSVKVIAFGGDAAGSMSMIGETDLSVIVGRMANSTKIEAGLPLSYVVRNVYNNQIVKVKLATEFDVTNCELVSTLVSDYDGNKYKIDTIGTQVWMLENLKTTKYNDGALIPLITDSAEWRSTTRHGYCYLHNNTENVKTYGCFYNLWAVISGKLAPKGWHVATSADWQTLINYMGGSDKAGGAMKGTAHWKAPNTGATNAYGFNVLSAGFHEMDGSWVEPGESAHFWTSSLSGNYGIFVVMKYDSEKVWMYNSYYNTGFPVRCVKD